MHNHSSVVRSDIGVVFIEYEFIDHRRKHSHGRVEHHVALAGLEVTVEKSEQLLSVHVESLIELLLSHGICLNTLENELDILGGNIFSYPIHAEIQAVLHAVVIKSGRHFVVDHIEAGLGINFSQVLHAEGCDDLATGILQPFNCSFGNFLNLGIQVLIVVLIRHSNHHIFGINIQFVDLFSN